MEVATLVWMGGMTAIAIIVERRTAALQKMIENHPNEASDSANVGKQAYTIAVQNNEDLDTMRDHLDAPESISGKHARGRCDE